MVQATCTEGQFVLQFDTPAGMKLLVKQLYLARDVTVDGPCSGSFTTIYNIPCYHDIRLLKQFSVGKLTHNDAQTPAV